MLVDVQSLVDAKTGIGDGIGDAVMAGKLHAHLTSLELHKHALRAQIGHDGICDIFDETLLELGAAAEFLNKAGECAKASDMPIGQVCDMRRTKEWDNMVCAQRVVRDIAQDDGAARRGLCRQGVQGATFDGNKAIEQERCKAIGCFFEFLIVGIWRR